MSQSVAIYRMNEAQPRHRDKTEVLPEFAFFHSLYAPRRMRIRPTFLS